MVQNVIFTFIAFVLIAISILFFGVLHQPNETEKSTFEQDNIVIIQKLD